MNKTTKTVIRDQPKKCGKSEMLIENESNGNINSMQVQVYSKANSMFNCKVLLCLWPSLHSV